MSERFMRTDLVGGQQATQEIAVEWCKRPRGLIMPRFIVIVIVVVIFITVKRLLQHFLKLLYCVGWGGDGISYQMSEVCKVYAKVIPRSACLLLVPQMAARGQQDRL